MGNFSLVAQRYTGSDATAGDWRLTGNQQAVDIVESMRGSIALEPAVMFGIMFLWQLPHTFAVARLYRDDYRRAARWARMFLDEEKANDDE